MTVSPNHDLEAGAPAYEGHNAAHRKFFAEFKYLNAYYYLFLSAKGTLQTHLANAVEQADRIAREQGRAEARALGVVTHAKSNTQFQVVLVPRPDAAAMAANFDGFLHTVSTHCVIACHRSLIDYAYDLLCEIDGSGQLAIPKDDRDAVRARSARPNRLLKALSTLGIPLTTTSDLERRIRLLAESRNCLEHNDGLATSEWCKHADGYALKPGDQLPISSKEVGESLAVVETVVRSLNLRACKKYRL
jgi:hypothetical protein